MITAKQISVLIESGNPCYLRRSFRRAVEAGAPQEHVHFLPRLPTHLLHVQVPLDLRAAAGSQEVLHRKKKKAKTSTMAILHVLLPSIHQRATFS